MKIQKTSLVDIVIERIKQYIIENDLKPNEKFLTEKELIDQLQVSRTVVREALTSLQAIGLLTIKRGGGIFLADTTLGSINTILKHHYETYGVKIKELIEVRKVLELGALRLLIEKEVQINIDKLHNINESYHQSILEKQDTKKYDQLFHETLIKSTNNDIFYSFSKIINEYFQLAKIEHTQSKESLLKSYEQHKNIINAIKEKDLLRAHEIMNHHFVPIFDFINKMEE